MGIFRGVGGTGESTSDSTINAVTELAVQAAASAASALASKNAAETAETNAEAAEATVAASAATAASNASNAATSATNAASSASSASSSASTATTQASNASSSASAASTSASNAASSASSASTSASTATTQAGIATTKASEASTSATNAASSASSASTSASNAASSASSASSSASSAAASAAAAAASFDAFDDIYLGAKASNPTVDNDGNALTTGDQYFNTTSNELRIWNGSSWQSPSVIGGTVTSLNVTGNTTLGDASTDTVQVNGYMGVGGAGVTTAGIYVRNSALSGVTQYGVLSIVTGTSAATNNIYGAFFRPGTEATAFTVANVTGLYIDGPTKGAGSTINNGYGLYIADQTQGTNNYGITSLVSSGTNKWNIYASGTAANYFAGNVGIGTNSPAFTLDVSGRVAASTDYLLRDTGGTARSVLTIDSNDDLLLQTGTTSGTRSVVLKTEGAERMRIDSSGNLLIGTTSAASTQGAPLQVITAIAARRNIATVGGPAFRFEKSRATTDGTYTIVANGDTLGEQQFYGADGVQYIIGASVKAVVDGTPGTNDMPTALVLSTTADGASSVTERMRIDSSGNLQMQTGAVMPYAPAPASISTTATLTNANIQAQIINTTGTSYTVTMPLGTTMETLASWTTTNVAYDFYVINTASGTITMAVNTGVTSLGGLTIATGTSAQFRIRRTAANTFVLYRLG